MKDDKIMAKYMKEIIIVTLYLGENGAERVLSVLANEWVRKGNKVTYVLLRPNMLEQSYTLYHEIHVIPFVSEGCKPVQLVKQVKFLKKIFNDNPNAIGIAFLNQAMLPLGLSSFFIKNKLIFAERNHPFVSPPGWHRRLVRNILFHIPDKCVFQTIAALNYFPKAIQKKGIVIENPINPLLPKRYCGEKEKVIVAAGRLDSQKNFPMLIRAFTMFNKEFQEYHLEIYGEGPLRAELENLIKELNMTDKIFLPGYEKNILERIRHAQVYVSSSDYEGISNSMLEAMALGVPVIITDCPIGGARLVIDDGINGILIPVGDDKALEKAMKKIISNENLLKSIADEAYKIREQYPVEVIAQKWLDIM